MIKIQDLDLDKLLVKVTPDRVKGKRAEIGIIGWNNMSRSQLNEINRTRNTDPEYNQYYIKLNKEYMVFDTDEQHSFNKLFKYLIDNNLYYEGAITKSFRGKTQNIPFKRHFWFKVNNQKQFKHIKENARIVFKGGGGEHFFGNGGFIAEFKDTILNNIPEIDISIYNDIMELLDQEEPVLKNKEIEKIEITDNMFSDDEEEEEVKKPVKQVKNNNIKIKKTIYKTDEDNDVDNEELQTILDGLAEKRHTDFNYWIIVYFIIINGGYDKELFEEFSKKNVKKYNKYENDKILKDIQPKEGYTIATLYFWLKEDNPELFKELCKNRNDFWKLQINNTTIANFYYQYNPDSYIYTYSRGWYEYDENNILIHRGDEPISLICGLGRQLQELATEQRNLITPKHPKYNEYNSFYSKFFNKVGSNDFINSTIKQLKQPYYKNIENQLNNKDLLAFNNILYDFRTNEFRKIEKNDYITITTGYDLKYKIVNNKIVPLKDEKIIKKIKDLIFSLFENQELVDYWFNITAMALFGNDKEQKFYVLSGKGSNGKSLTQKIIKLALGYYYKVGSNSFFTSSTKRGGADPELLELQGVRYFSVSEPDDTEGKKFNMANMKNYTGDDLLKARGLYEKKLVEFPAQFTIFINCNDLPELSETSDAVRRRVRNINFPFQFKEERELKNNKNYRLININLGDEITKPEYIQNFILLLLEIANKNKGKLINTPKIVLETSNKYCDENNILYDWFSNTFEKTDDSKDRQTAKTLLECYNQSEYCKKKLCCKDFSKLMEKLNIENKKIHNVSYYINIKFIEIQEINELD